VGSYLQNHEAMVRLCTPIYVTKCYKQCPFSTRHERYHFCTKSIVCQLPAPSTKKRPIFSLLDCVSPQFAHRHQHPDNDQRIEHASGSCVVMKANCNLTLHGDRGILVPYRLEHVVKYHEWMVSGCSRSLNALPSAK
jgi:hypothetical protein